MGVCGGDSFHQNLPPFNMMEHQKLFFLFLHCFHPDFVLVDLNHYFKNWSLLLFDILSSRCYGTLPRVVDSSPLTSTQQQSIRRSRKK